MLPEHFIQFVALAAEDRVMIKYLKPGDAPKAEFCEVPSGTVYEYCNLHEPVLATYHGHRHRDGRDKSPERAHD